MHAIAKVRCCTVVAMTLMSLAAVAPATAAEVLFGSTSNGPGNLYPISPSTGAATLVGPTGFTRVSALAARPKTPPPDVLYGIGSSGAFDAPVLFTIDPATGAGTLIGPLGVGNVPVTDMSLPMERSSRS